jgi:hypothetical protein
MHQPMLSKQAAKDSKSDIKSSTIIKGDEGVLRVMWLSRVIKGDEVLTVHQGLTMVMNICCEGS